MNRIINHRNLVSEWSAIQSGDDVLIEPGDYQLEAPLTLLARKHVRISGPGAHLQSVGHHALIQIQNCQQVFIEDLELSGLGYLTQQNSNYFALIQLEIENAYLTFSRLYLHDSGNHGVGHLNGPRLSDYCRVLDCRFERGGNLAAGEQKIDGAAIAIGGCGTEISGCKISRWLRGVEIESGAGFTHAMRDITIRNTVFEHNLWQAITVMPCWSDAALRAKLCGEIFIEDNYISGWGDETPVPLVADGKNVGIMWGGGSDSVIRRNTICRMRQGMGVHLSGDFAPVSNMRIEDNTIHDCAHGGYMGSNQVSPNPYAVRDVMWSGNRIRRCAYYGLRTMKGATASKDQLLAANDIAECKENLHEDELPVKPIP